MCKLFTYPLFYIGWCILKLFIIIRQYHKNVIETANTAADCSANIYAKPNILISAILNV